MEIPCNSGSDSVSGVSCGNIKKSSECNTNSNCSWCNYGDDNNNGTCEDTLSAFSVHNTENNRTCSGMSSLTASEKLSYKKNCETGKKWCETACPYGGCIDKDAICPVTKPICKDFAGNIIKDSGAAGGLILDEYTYNKHDPSSKASDSTLQATLKNILSNMSLTGGESARAAAARAELAAAAGGSSYVANPGTTSEASVETKAQAASILKSLGYSDHMGSELSSLSSSSLSQSSIDDLLGESATAEERQQIQSRILVIQQIKAQLRELKIEQKTSVTGTGSDTEVGTGSGTGSGIGSGIGLDISANYTKSLLQQKIQQQLKEIEQLLKQHQHGESDPISYPSYNSGTKYLEFNVLKYVVMLIILIIMLSIIYSFVTNSGSVVLQTGILIIALIILYLVL